MMPRTRRNAVSKGNDPVPVYKSVFDEPKMAELYRVFKEDFDRMNSQLDSMDDYFD